MFNCKNFITKLFLSFFIISFVLPTLVMATEDHSSANIKELKTEYNQKYIDNLLNDYGQDYINKILQEYGQEYIEEILEEIREQEEGLFNLYNKQLFSFPLVPDSNFPIKAGVYVSDLVKAAFCATNIIFDRILYNKLITYHTNYVFEKINQDTESLKNIIVELNLDCFEDDCLNNEGKTILQEFISNHYPINLQSLPRGTFIKDLLFYSIISDIYRVFRIKYLFEDSSLAIAIIKSLLEGNFSALTKYHQQQQFTKSGTGLDMLISLIKGQKPKPIPIFNFIDIFMWTSRPLTTSLSHGTHWLNYLCNYFINESYRPTQTNLENENNNKQNLDQDFKPWWVRLVSCYPTLFIKELFILATSIKWLDCNVYQKALCDHITENFDEFQLLIKKYHHLKTEIKGNKRDNADFIETEQALKNFLKQASAVPFKEWVSKKNEAFAKKEFLVNLVANIPMYLTAGVLAHKKCMENDWYPQIGNGIKNFWNWLQKGIS